MPDDQDRFTIGALMKEGIITAHKDGNYGSLYPRVAEFGDEGVPFLTAKLISDDGQIDWENAPRLNNEKADSLNYGFIEGNDVLLSHNATIGRVALVPELEERVLVGTSLTYFRLDSTRLLPRYLATFFRGRGFQHQLASVMSHTTRNQVPITAQRKLSIAVPPMAEQRAIASVLGALDDKIELNRRMNATLESLARAIFKSWFVDFDPVKINAGMIPASSAIPTTHDPKVLDLFPSTFQDSELGPIPEGWDTERFADHISVTRGLSYKGAGLANEGFPMHNLNSIHEGGGYKHEGIKYYTGEYRNKHEVVPGDLIVTNTEQGFEHRLIGCAALVPKRFGETGIYSHHIYRIRRKDTSPLSPHYLLRLINSSRYHSWIAGFSNGTTINMLPTDALEMPRLVRPPAEAVHLFTELASEIADQIEDSISESESLAATRDTLLPRLLSGDLPVDGLLEEE